MTQDKNLAALGDITNRIVDLWAAGQRDGMKDGVEICAKTIADYSKSIADDLTIDSAARDAVSGVLAMISDQFRFTMLAMEFK